MRTKHRDFRDDDSDSTRDRLFESVEESIEGYMELFRRLQTRADQHGFSSFVCLSTVDPMTNYSTYRAGMVGNRYQNIGATCRAMRSFEED